MFGRRVRWSAHNQTHKSTSQKEGGYRPNNGVAVAMEDEEGRGSKILQEHVQRPSWGLQSSWQWKSK